MKKIAWIVSLVIAVAVVASVWYIQSKKVEFAPTIDGTEEMAKIPEYQRLWWFEAINMGKNRKDIDGLDGSGVRVTVMGEEADSSHPQLKGRIHKQYNAFAKKGAILEGKRKQAYNFETMGYGDGHGTHIVGTIAAISDGKGVEGVASGVSLDLYDIGAYDSAEKLSLKGYTKNDNEVGMFLTAFKTALDDVCKKGISKITTGSFNVESPYIPLKHGGKLENKSIQEISDEFESSVNNIDDFFKSKLFEYKNPNDKDRLKGILKEIDEKSEIPEVMMGITFSKSKEWKALEESIHNYQQKGGVYIITESNHIFGKTSILNAMPTISDKVNKELWISTVMIYPKDFDTLESLEERRNAIKTSEWEAPINDCGRVAKEYCIVVPSYNVLSTMTKKVRMLQLPLYKIDGGYYQSYTGHSMGAPMIAAALALMEQKNRKEHLGYNMRELVAILKKSANRHFKGYNSYKHGQGMLDVKAALKAM